jgi:hypothetical protein
MAMSVSEGLSRAVGPALLAVVLMLAAPGVTSRRGTLEAVAVTDSQVKAAFLYNFASFVVWPGTSAGPLVIGIAGDDAFAEIVAQTVRQRKVNGREFQTRRMKSADDPSGCHILYVGVMRPHDATELMERVTGPILTVGETPQFLRDGGMVRFHIENNKVRFQINQKNAETAGLKVSSLLLALAAR